MRTALIILVVLAAAVTLTAAAAAGPDTARKQRVVITTQAKTTASVSPMVLTVLQNGALESDVGSLIASDSGDVKVVMRDGQEVSIYTAAATFRGKRGSLVMRFRAEYVAAGNGYHAGIGTWRVIRGTGTYATVAGAGRYGSVWLDRGPWSSRGEGFLTLR